MTVPVRAALPFVQHWSTRVSMDDVVHFSRGLPGEEGFVGPAANAEAALAALLAELRSSPAFQKLFSHAAFYEKSFHPGGLPSDGAASSSGL